MVDVSKAPFKWEAKPNGSSWVDKLSAAQAVAQCEEWGVDTDTTLEANRAILKNKIKQSDPAKTTTAERQAVTANPVAPPDYLQIIQATAAAVGAKVAEAMGNQGLQSRAQNRLGDLPRVLSDMVATVPICSGMEGPKLLKLLIAFYQLCGLDLAEPRQIMVALLPKTTGQLRTVWVEALTAEEDYQELGTRVIDVFLPDRAKQKLISDTIYRVQGTNESLSEFITQVRDSAKILLPAQTDLLEIVITGINAQTRARLAGFQAPSTIEQLLALIPRLEVVRSTETSPIGQSGARNEHYAPQRDRDYYQGHQSSSRPPVQYRTGYRGRNYDPSYQYRQSNRQFYEDQQPYRGSEDNRNTGSAYRGRNYDPAYQNRQESRQYYDSQQSYNRSGQESRINPTQRGGTSAVESTRGGRTEGNSPPNSNQQPTNSNRGR